MDYQKLRNEYTIKVLNEHDVNPNPFLQFEAWFQDALQQGTFDPNAMTLATASQDGVPSARIVLLKGLDEKGFVFYTNKQSQKGLDLLGNPKAALVFYWSEAQRQIRITGEVEDLTTEESEAYFKTRPHGSKLGAWASNQSRKLSSRKALEEAYRAFEEKFQNADIPKPDYWGGYRVIPTRIEFWQGRENRLHDRLVYTLEQNSHTWKLSRLYP